MKKKILSLFILLFLSHAMFTQSVVKTIQVEDTIQIQRTKFFFRCHMEIPTSKEVQEFLSLKIFEEKGKDLQTSFDDFMKLWKCNPRVPAIYNFCSINIDLRREYELKGKFACFRLKISMEGRALPIRPDQVASDKQKRLQYDLFSEGQNLSFIYDIQTHKIVNIDEVFNPAVSNKLKEIFGSDIKLYTEDRCIQLVSSNGDGRFIFSDVTERNFTDYFKQLVGWGNQPDYDTPEFLHGYKGMKEYFGSKDFIIESENAVTDSVLVSVTIAEDGSVRNPIIKSIPDYCDVNKLMPLLKKMPKWKPAYKDGKPYAKDATFALKVGGIYEVIERNPEFPGGKAELMKWLNRNLRYPSTCSKEGIQGRVLVQFIVNTDGTIVEPKVTRPVHPDIDREALRVVSIMPRWIPGKQRGNTVRVRYTLPVTFRLK